MSYDIKFMWFCFICQDYHKTSEDCPKVKVLGEAVIVIPEPDDEWDDYAYGFG